MTIDLTDNLQGIIQQQQQPHNIDDPTSCSISALDGKLDFTFGSIDIFSYAEEVHNKFLPLHIFLQSNVNIKKINRTVKITDRTFKDVDGLGHLLINDWHPSERSNRSSTIIHN